MHIAMMTELKEGLSKMKYCLNHHWRFELLTIAFFVGFFQAWMVVFVTLLNYYVIIGDSFSVIDVTKDFIAMMIIADFDNMFFLEYPKTNILKDILLQHNENNLSYFRI